jgi:hypothetical protein
MEMLAIASTRSGDYLKSTSSSLMGFFSSGPKVLAGMGERWYGDHIDTEYIINKYKKIWKIYTMNMKNPYL